MAVQMKNGVYEAKSYEVKSGDNLTSIARKQLQQEHKAQGIPAAQHITHEELVTARNELARINGIKNPNHIRAGQTLHFIAPVKDGTYPVQGSPMTNATKGMMEAASAMRAMGNAVAATRSPMISVGERVSPAAPTPSPSASAPKKSRVMYAVGRHEPPQERTLKELVRDLQKAGAIRK